MDGECALLQHSAVLVCHPSVCRFLAQDAPLTVSAVVVALGSHHLCARLGYMAVAFGTSLFVAVDVAARSASDVFGSQNVHAHTLRLWNPQIER
jgi:hypothetical protein